MVIRNKNNNIDNLKNLYKTIGKLITNEQCYYTREEIEKIKENENNKFFEGGDTTNERRRL